MTRDRVSETRPERRVSVQVKLHRELHRRLKRRVLDLDRSMQEHIEELIKRDLAEEP